MVRVCGSKSYSYMKTCFGYLLEASFESLLKRHIKCVCGEISVILSRKKCLISSYDKICRSWQHWLSSRWEGNYIKAPVNARIFNGKVLIFFLFLDKKRTLWVLIRSAFGKAHLITHSKKNIMWIPLIFGNATYFSYFSTKTSVRIRSILLRHF